MGLVQGLGWPSLANILYNNVPKNRVGFLWSLMGIGGNLASLTSPILMVWSMHQTIPFLEQSQTSSSSSVHWRHAFALAAALCLIGSLVAYFMLPHLVCDDATKGEGTKDKGSVLTQFAHKIRELGEVGPLLLPSPTKEEPAPTYTLLSIFSMQALSIFSTNLIAIWAPFLFKFYFASAATSEHQDPLASRHPLSDILLLLGMGSLLIPPSILVGYALSFLEGCSLLGTVFSGLVCDLLHKGNRFETRAFFSFLSLLLAMVACAFVFTFPKTLLPSHILSERVVVEEEEDFGRLDKQNVTLLFMLTLCVTFISQNGLKNMGGLLIRDYASSKNPKLVGSISGLNSIAAEVGSALAGGPVGLFIGHYGYMSIFVGFLVSAAISWLLMNYIRKDMNSLFREKKE